MAAALLSPLVMQSRDLGQPSGQAGRYLSLWFAVVRCLCPAIFGAKRRSAVLAEIR